MIISLAGRRIDAPAAEISRFPLSHTDLVRKRLTDFFISVHATHIVCSGAAGADLLALEAAGELNMQRSMILPFHQDIFRSSSVTDRDGNWGQVYDRIVADLLQSNHLVVLNYLKEDPLAYEKTNREMLNYAVKLAGQLKASGMLPAGSSVTDNILVAIVWDGKPKDANDTTHHFLVEAEKRDLKIREINTLY